MGGIRAGLVRELVSLLARLLEDTALDFVSQPARLLAALPGDTPFELTLVVVAALVGLVPQQAVAATEGDAAAPEGKVAATGAAQGSCRWEASAFKGRPGSGRPECVAGVRVGSRQY